MPEPATSTPSRAQLIVFGLIAVAVVAGMITVGQLIDKYADRERPMYHDLLQMAAWQYDLLEDGKPGVELTVDSDSGPVQVGGHSFTPLPGVEIVVEQRDDSFCVHGRNEHDDETEWECVDGTGPRPEVGMLAREFAKED